MTLVLDLILNLIQYAQKGREHLQSNCFRVVQVRWQTQARGQWFDPTSHTINYEDIYKLGRLS